MEHKLASCIDGEYIAVATGTQGGYAATPSASPNEIERALAVAHRVHTDGIWRKLAPAERCDVLAKVCATYDDAVAEKMAKADASETGVPINVTRMIDGSLKEAFTREAMQDLCTAASSRSMRTSTGAFRQMRRPHGVALILVPWNVPSGTIVGKLIAALIAGCPVIVKPSEVAPTGVEHFLRAIQSAGLPKGVLQWLHGGADVGAALLNDPRVRVVNFTGSAAVGREVARVCADRFVPTLMECGGSNVAIVLEDADVDAAASAIAQGITMLNGQWCAGISRVIAHETLLDDLVTGVLKKFGELCIGPADDDKTEFGPLSHKAHRDKIEAICADLRKQGGSVHRAPGAETSAPDGNFFLPALIKGLSADVQPDEIFGPIAVVQSFKDPTDAVRIANKQSMLQSYVFSKDTEKALDLASTLVCGSVMVNGVGFGFDGVTTESGTPHEPVLTFFGAAGLGTEQGGAGAVHFFAGAQCVGVNG